MGNIRFSTLEKSFNIGYRKINSDLFTLNNNVLNSPNINLSTQRELGIKYISKNLTNEPKLLTKPMEDNSRRAWLLFLSSNNYYLYMLLGVYKNLLDVRTKYPIYCCVTEEVSDETKAILRTIGLNLIELDTSIIGDSLRESIKEKTCEHYFQAFTKLTILDTDIEKIFDKIVYLDTDVQIYENIDDIFEYPHMSAIEDLAPAVRRTAEQYVIGKSIFCSGLFVWDFKENPGKGHEILMQLPLLDKNIS